MIFFSFGNPRNKFELPLEKRVWFVIDWDQAVIGENEKLQEKEKPK
jgi:hypothetical protein